MKKILKPGYLPWITLAAGAVGLLLRLWLFASATDEKGFLRTGHVAEYLIWILTGITLVLLLLCTTRLLEAPKYQFNFPRSLPGAVGCILAAAGICVSSVVELLSYTDTLTLISSLTGFLATAGLLYVGRFRWMGQKPNVLCHVVICLYLMLRLVSQYRHWSWDPQLQDYAFHLLAAVALMLAAYHRATFDAGIGKRRPHVFYHLAAVYFCCLALVGSESFAFYLGCGAWMLTDLCSLIPMPRGEA